MATNQLKNKNVYFYLYIAAPLVLPLANYFTMNEREVYVAFYVTALICAVFDQRALVRSKVESETHIVGSALGIVLLPPIYAYARARDTGMKKWRWLFTYIAIRLFLIMTGAYSGSGSEAGYS